MCPFSFRALATLPGPAGWVNPAMLGVQSQGQMEDSGGGGGGGGRKINGRVKSFK